jgi:5-methylcytosine-specific restriction endonuclease McrA
MGSAKWNRENPEKVKAIQVKYYKENAEKIKARSAKYRKDNPEKVKAYRVKYRKDNPEKVKAARAKWDEKNPEKMKIYMAEYHKKYRKDNPEKMKAARARWNEKNPEKVREKDVKYCNTPKGRANIARKSHRRRKSISAVENTLTAAQWDKILKNQNGCCAICKREFSSRLKPTRDHIIPLKEGGGLTYENVQALCKSCNSRKGDKIGSPKIASV